MGRTGSGFMMPAAVIISVVLLGRGRGGASLRMEYFHANAPKSRNSSKRCAEMRQERPSASSQGGHGPEDRHGKEAPLRVRVNPMAPTHARRSANQQRGV